MNRTDKNVKKKIQKIVNPDFFRQCALMSDAAIIAVVGAVSGVFTAAITAYFGYKIKRTTDTTLKHVNHAVIAQAKVYAASARLNADLSDNPGYRKIAEDAEAALEALIKAQESIDRGEGKT